MENPLVSVLIAYYNDFDYIRETVESVYNQTYKNFELIVVDDCSPNIDAQNYIKSLSKEFCFKLIRHETNLGSAMAMQTAFEASNGQYIVSTGQDDPMLPHKIEYQLDKLLELDVDVLTCAGKTLDMSTGIEKPFETVKNIIEVQKASGANGVINLLEDYDNMQHYSIQGSIYKRKIFEDTKWIRQSFKQDDWPFSIYIWKNYRVYFDDEIVYKYRIHSDNSHKNYFQILQYEVTTTNYFISPKKRDNTFAWIIINKGHLCLLSENYVKAIKYVVAGLFLSTSPANISYALHLIRSIDKKYYKYIKRKIYYLISDIIFENKILRNIIKFIISLIPNRKVRHKLRNRLGV